MSGTAFTIFALTLLVLGIGFALVVDRDHVCTARGGHAHNFLSGGGFLCLTSDGRVIE